MAEPTAAHARELGDYLLIARRRWRIIVGGAAVGLVLALVYLQLAQLTYASTATLQVESTAADTTSEGDRTNDAINLDTEAQLVKSELVADQAAKLLESEETTRRLASRVTVTVPANTTVLAITYRATTAAEAQRGAQAFADAYLDNRRDTAQEVLLANETRLRDQIDKLQSKIEVLSGNIVALSGPGQKADRAFLVAKRVNLNNQLASFNGDLAPVAGAQVRPGRMLTAATLPRTPVDPNPLLVLPSGLMAGLLAGVVLAGLRERGDKRIHSAVDIERIFGVKPLATMPWGDGSLADPTGVRLDAEVRVVYHSLRANGPVTTESTVVVAPEAALAGERLAFSLAVTASRAGATALYITRQGKVSPSDRAVAAGAQGRLSLPDYESIDAVVDGEVHASALAKRLLTLRRQHDFLVLGLPNSDPFVDLPLLGRQVDIAVVVVALGRTRRDSVESVLSGITKSGIEHVAVVVLEKPHRRARHRTQRLNVINAHPELATGEEAALASTTEPTQRSATPGGAPRTKGGPNGSPPNGNGSIRSARTGSTSSRNGHDTSRNREVRRLDLPAGGEARP